MSGIRPPTLAELADMIRDADPEERPWLEERYWAMARDEYGDDAEHYLREKEWLTTREPPTSPG